MKGFTKFCLVAGGVCIFAGGGMVVSASVLGVNYDLMQQELQWRERPENPERPEKPDKLAGISSESKGTYMDISELDIKAAGVNLEIIEDDTLDGITVYPSSLSGEFKEKQSGGKLTIEYRRRNLNIKNDISESIEIRIPADYHFEEVELEITASDAKLEQLLARKADIEVSAGNLSIDQLTVDEMDVECKAGNVQIEGAIGRNLDVECNVGDVNFNLTNKQSEFNLDLKNTMGSIAVGDFTYDSLDGKRKIENNDANKTMELECKMGSVNIYFME